MKKFTKMLALGLAAALTFGMTVSAAGSNDTTQEVADGVNVVIGAVGVQDSSGNAVDVKAEASALPEDAYNENFGVDYDDALAKVDSNDAVNAAIDAAFATLENKTEKKVYRDIIDVKVEGTIPAGGLYVPLLPSSDGEAYVIAHWNGSGWEVLQTKVEDGVVYALFPQSFSPVYLSILTVAGDVIPDSPVTDVVDKINGVNNSDRWYVQNSKGENANLTVYVNSYTDSQFAGWFSDRSRNDVIGDVEALEAVQSVLRKGDVAYRDIISIVPGGDIPEGGIWVPVWHENNSQTQVVAHWNGTAWEVLPTKAEGGIIYAFTKDLSPVYIAIINVRGGDTTPGTPAGGAPVSPKTGETLPVAGMMAVICLAGVAVCAKKARCSK